MTETDDEAEICRIDILPPKIFSAETAQVLVAGFLIALVFVLLFHPTFHRTQELLTALGIRLMFGVLIAALFRRKTSAIVVTKAGITLPGGPWKASVLRLPLNRIRGIFVARRGLVRYLVIKTAKSSFAVPTARLPSPDALARLRAALDQALDAHPESASLRETIAVTQANAEWRAGVVPVASWTAIAVIVSVHVWLRAHGRATDLLALTNLGAMAPSLVWHGGWYRVFTANLIEASDWRLTGDCICLFVIGCFLERLVGSQHFLLLLAGSAVAAQLAAAALWPGIGLAISSGSGPAIFGLFGATAIIAIHFARRVPDTIPFPGRPFTMLAGYLALAAILHWNGGNWAANGAGFLTGLIGGELVCRGRADYASLRKTHSLASESLLVVCAVFAIALGTDAWHATSPAHRLTDTLIIAKDLSAHPETDPKAVSDFAVQVAKKRDAPGSLRHAAIPLASRSCAAGGIMASLTAAVEDASDTYGGVDNPPADLATALFWPPDPMPPWFDKLLDRLGAESKPAILGDGNTPALPTLRLGGGVIGLEAPSAFERGAQLYALVRDSRGTIAGMIFIMVPPGFSGSQILPVPTSFRAPSTEPPPPLWTDKDTRLQLAVVDLRPCDNRGPVMGPSFYPNPKASGQ
jgi:membrane associated rhomboid family serine protease